ncbi:MAG TPA: HAMP domain-containing protein, partial [Devosia sp.]|nr:HAMP domain-containing protein [Devosia sp.]
MRGSLFLKIYLTVLGGIAILALAGLMAVLLSGGREDGGWLDQRAELLAAALSETDSGSMQAALDKLGPASGGELSVRDSNGALIASYEPTPNGESKRFDPVSVPVGGGAILTARFELPSQAAKGNPLLLLTLVTSLTALAAWPVVRHLTGRLERLRRGVDAWGEGDLSLRVPVEGRDEIAAVATSFNN